mmetsp:Transcript_21880/g.70693  ORF Transcript_21880/g.70693 Transcript_21880/m.70693 type:complete len:227 (+) Transcript_21880:362-1042(+)
MAKSTKEDDHLLPRFETVLSSVMNVPPMLGSLMRAKKDIMEMNCSVEHESYTAVYANKTATNPKLGTQLAPPASPPEAAPACASEAATATSAQPNSPMTTRGACTSINALSGRGPAVQCLDKTGRAMLTGAKAADNEAIVTLGTPCSTSLRFTSESAAAKPTERVKSTKRSERTLLSVTTLPACRYVSTIPSSSLHAFSVFSTIKRDEQMNTTPQKKMNPSSSTYP